MADAFLTALAPAELDALSRARRTQLRWTPHCERAPNANSSESDTPPLWLSVSLIEWTPIIDLSPLNSNVAGRRR